MPGGKISEYTVAGPLLGTELLDVSQVDGLSITGYSTRSVTLDDLYDYFVDPNFYTQDSALSTNRTVDQDGKFLIFEGGTYFQVDGVNDGIYYDFVTKKGGIGTEFPDAKWHVKANAGQNTILCEDSTGIDTLWQDSDGKVYFRSTALVDSLELRTTGGNRARISNNSNELGIRSIGYVILEGGGGAGAAIITDGEQIGASSYQPASRVIEMHSNYALTSEIRYLRFSSISGTQEARFGSSDADGLRFDKIYIYSAETYHSGLFENNGNFKMNADIEAGGIPTYADEAAAVIGGLGSNKFYKTATGELRIKL